MPLARHAGTHHGCLRVSSTLPVPERSKRQELPGPDIQASPYVEYASRIVGTLFSALEGRQQSDLQAIVFRWRKHRRSPPGENGALPRARCPPPAAGTAESRDLDWKSELPPAKGIAQTDFPKDVAAMANSGGDVIVFGVREQQKAATGRLDVGDFDEEYERSLRSAAITAISPPVFGLNVYRLGVEGNRAVVVEVPPSVDGPHLIYKNDYFGAHRVMAGCRQLTAAGQTAVRQLGWPATPRDVHSGTSRAGQRIPTRGRTSSRSRSRGTRNGRRVPRIR